MMSRDWLWVIYARVGNYCDGVEVRFSNGLTIVAKYGSDCGPSSSITQYYDGKMILHLDELGTGELSFIIPELKYLNALTKKIKEIYAILWRYAMCENIPIDIIRGITVMMGDREFADFRSISKEFARMC